MSKQSDPTQRIYSTVPQPPNGTGPGSGGQSGDTQALPEATVSSESVTELVEEGQYFEAEVVIGVAKGSGATIEELHVAMARRAPLLFPNRKSARDRPYLVR